MSQLHFATDGARWAASVMDRCAREKIMTVVIAPPGRGKSYATSRWSRENGLKTRHVRLSCTFRTSPHGLLAAICLGLDMADMAGRRTDKVCLALSQRLAEDPVFLIIDEADMLMLSALDKLRGIWDEVSELRGTDGEHAFPMLLCGTERLRTMLMREDLERLRSRVGEWGEMPPLKVGEVEQIVEKKWPGVRLDEAALPQLYELSHHGSFRWLNRVMSIASEIAAKDGKVVNARVLKGTRKHLIGLPEEA